MSTLNLRCPSCDEPLALDAAFASGICRCTSCEAMIDVNASRDDSAPSAPTSTKPRKTPSTRQRKPRIPRILLGVPFVFLVALFAVAISITQRDKLDRPPETSPSGGDARRAALGFDPDANPFQATGATFLGLPMPANTALIIDCSQSRQPWIPTIQSVLHRLSTEKMSDGCFVIAAREDGPHRLGERWSDLTPIQVRGLSSRGLADLASAAAMALASGADTLIFVRGRPVFTDEANAVDVALRDGGTAVAVHALAVNLEGDDAISQLAETRGGESRHLTAHRIQHWLAGDGP